jgi:hypothetical protein
VDGVRDDSGDEFAVPDGARAERRGASIAKKIAGVDIGWSQWFAGFAPRNPLPLLVPI